MIEINLLPGEARKKKRSPAKIDVSVISSVPSLPVFSMVVRAVVVVLSIQLIVFVAGVGIESVFKSLESRYKDILPKKQETEKLKIKVDTTNNKVAAIDELMVKRFSWEKKLNSLSDSMAPGIWLTELVYDEKTVAVLKVSSADPAKKKGRQPVENAVSRYLVISGAASSMSEEGTALIGRFIKSLKDDPTFYSDFSDIELGTIKREKMEDQEIMTFKITCPFKGKR